MELDVELYFKSNKLICDILSQIPARKILFPKNVDT